MGWSDDVKNTPDNRPAREIAAAMLDMQWLDPETGRKTSYRAMLTDPDADGEMLRYCRLLADIDKETKRAGLLTKEEKDLLGGVTEGDRAKLEMLNQFRGVYVRTYESYKKGEHPAETVADMLGCPLTDIDTAYAQKKSVMDKDIVQMETLTALGAALLQKLGISYEGPALI